MAATVGSIDNELQPYSVVVVGAGIGGLAAAIALSCKALDATVLEGKPELNGFGASIGIDPHAEKAIRSYGLEEQFKPYVTENRYIDIRNGADNKVLDAIFHNKANTSDILWGAPRWNIHRADYHQLLAAVYSHSVENGSEIWLATYFQSAAILSTWEYALFDFPSGPNTSGDQLETAVNILVGLFTLSRPHFGKILHMRDPSTVLCQASNQLPNLPGPCLAT